MGGEGAPPSLEGDVPEDCPLFVDPVLLFLKVDTMVAGEQVVEGGEIDIEGEERGGPGSKGEERDGPGSDGEERGGPGSLSLTPDIVKGRGDEEEEDSPRTPGGIVTISRLPDMLDHTPHSQGEPDR